MQPHLNPILDHLGLQGKPRYTLEETADILGIRRDQVLDLLKRGKLIGFRASERRWGGIAAEHLDDYIGRVNARWGQRRQVPSETSVAMTSSDPVPTPPPKLPVSSFQLLVPLLPPLHDPSGAMSIADSPAPLLTPKPKLNF